MTDRREMLMKEIAKLSFAALETNLYLDGHPDNKEALKYYDNTSKELKSKTEEYEKEYGPLTAMGSKNDKEWQWSTQKWPWQMED